MIEYVPDWIQDWFSEDDPATVPVSERSLSVPIWAVIAGVGFLVWISCD